MQIPSLRASPIAIAIFLPIALLVIFVAINYVKFPQVATVEEETTLEKYAAEDSGLAAQVCPSECCAPGGAYLEKACQGTRTCINGECEKKECPFECCDDESSRAEYTPMACDGNLLCSDNKCVLKECWLDCCVGRQGHKEKPCDANMVCNSGICEKPNCPDKYKCCPENDAQYKEKKCTGNNVCKFRVCKAP